MRPSHKIIAEFVGVFVIGAVAGGLIGGSLVDTQLTTFMNKVANKPDAIVKRINAKYVSDYHLSPEEISKIQPEVNDLAERIYRERHKFGLDIMATLDEYHGKIAAQLTPEHREAYEKAMAERRQKLRTMLLPDQGDSDGQK